MASYVGYSYMDILDELKIVFHPTSYSLGCYIYEIIITRRTCLTFCREYGMSYLCRCLKAYCKTVVKRLGRKEGRGYVLHHMAFIFENSFKNIVELDHTIVI